MEALLTFCDCNAVFLVSPSPRESQSDSIQPKKQNTSPVAKNLLLSEAVEMNVSIPIPEVFTLASDIFSICSKVTCNCND